MGRWLLISGCLFVVSALTYSDATRAPDAQHLGGACSTTHECRKGTTCLEVEGVLSGQCSTACNATDACQQQFGAAAICLGADVCARTCEASRDCPSGTACNTYGWCERPLSSE
jgi:hypothetical protein